MTFSERNFQCVAGLTVARVTSSGLLVLFILSSTSCGISVAGNPGKPKATPTPNFRTPPSASLDFNFGTMGEESSDTSQQLGLNLLEGTQWNYGWASLVLASTNIGVIANTIVPAAALGSAIAQKPRYLGHDRWLWRFSFPLFDATFTTSLTARTLNAQEREWEMVLDRVPLDANGCCSKFVWVRGVEQGNTGTWTINDPAKPNSVTPASMVTWSYSSNEKRTLQLTLLADPVGVEDWKKDGFVRYVRNEQSMVVVIDKIPGDEKSTTISWDMLTLAGNGVSDEGNKVCWDSGKFDVPCVD